METNTRIVIQVHPADNVLVALRDLAAGQHISWRDNEWVLLEAVPAKHKFNIQALHAGDPIIMYGVQVGKAKIDLPPGSRLSPQNVAHATGEVKLSTGPRKVSWQAPDVSRWKDRVFYGYHRSDGRVGTANHWIVVPLVFCENRNTAALKEAMQAAWGYQRPKIYTRFAQQLAELYRTGKSLTEILSAPFEAHVAYDPGQRLFAHVDGIQFLSHTGGCGGTRDDARTLCGLLAGYITHPNVAGATVLSLGCQNAQVSLLQEEIQRRDPHFNKPLIILEQQRVGLEDRMLSEAIRQTFAGLIQANECRREPAPLSKLCIGLECGGSDGFSGISANPAIGYTSDLLVALGGSVILSEFPELCGVEQELCDRCVEEELARRFLELMRAYQRRAEMVGSGFDMNPSPGNIRDGLITDAMKSAGAAKKGGTSPITDVLDYPEWVRKPGLNLLCTPGNDVESTSAEVGAGANVVLFTTGLGTPTGNPIAPVIKISSNTALYQHMPDIIDVNAGTIIDGEETIEQAGARILDEVIAVASGQKIPAAVRNGQEDFIPWKRGVSL
ncbi:MAG: altronate dehydratase family protein [Thermoflavifilum sp.]|nr:altronate dehydratase family protein [Thermoflavifilum sp.]